MQYSVIVVNDFAHVEGGATQVAISSAIGLANQGHEVTYLSAVKPIAAELLKSPVHVVVTGQRAIADNPNRIIALMQGLWNRTASRSMERILRELDPRRTVVHLHGWTKALSSSVIRAALSRKFKVICTLHDYFSACPNGSFFNYPKNRICDLRPLSTSCIASQCDRRNYGHKLWRVLRQVVQNNFGGLPREIRHFIVVSPFSEQILRPFLSRDSRIYPLQNPVQASYDDAVDVRSNSAFAMVGRIAQEKGPQVFAEAAQLAGCEAMFIGDGDKHEDVLTLCPSAIVTGWLSHNDMRNCLSSARALVFPSLWYETDGLAVMEAAAIGIPAIVSDVSAARSSVIDGVTGSWFKAGNALDLANKIEGLSDDDLAAKMGRAAYERYWKNPRTLDRHIRELEQIYEKVLAC